MDLLDKVKKLLAREFRPPDEVNLRDEEGIIGVVVSKKFKTIDTFDRQTLLRRLLDKGLEPAERKRVLIIVAVTPEEHIGHTSV